MSGTRLVVVYAHTHPVAFDAQMHHMALGGSGASVNVKSRVGLMYNNNNYRKQTNATLRHFLWIVLWSNPYSAHKNFEQEKNVREKDKKRKRQ